MKIMWHIHRSKIAVLKVHSDCESMKLVYILGFVEFDIQKFNPLSPFSLQK